ncbi:MAG: hypothetical protein R3B41_03570 [Candidatus Doudnabacteria bacterium]
MFLFDDEMNTDATMPASDAGEVTEMPAEGGEEMPAEGEGDNSEASTEGGEEAAEM